MGIVNFVQTGKIDSTAHFIGLVKMADRNLQGQAQDDFLVNVCKTFLKLKEVQNGKL